MKNHASVSQQKVFWNNQTFSSLSKGVRLVMAIATVLAIVTILAIVTMLAIVNVVAIKTVMHLSGIEPSIKYKGLVSG